MRKSYINLDQKCTYAKQKTDQNPSVEITHQYFSPLNFSSIFPVCFQYKKNEFIFQIYVTNG